MSEASSRPPSEAQAPPPPPSQDEALARLQLLDALRAGDKALVYKLVVGSEDAPHPSSAVRTLYPLHVAVRVAEVPMISYLLTLRSIDINERDEQLNTPLHVACATGRADVVLRLLQDGSGVNDALRNKDGKTPLEVCKTWDCAVILQKSQAHLNASFQSLLSAYIPISKPNLTTPPTSDLLALLSSPRAHVLELGYIDRPSGQTLLHAAAAKRDFAVVKAAVEKAGAQPGVLDARRKSVLQTTRDEGIKAFLKLQERQRPTNGADIGQPRNKKGYLRKYVNVAQGWQMRWFVLNDGVLSYYLSHDDELKNCRGAINLAFGRLKEDRSGDARKFEVASTSTPGPKFLLKADHPTDGASWRQAIELSIVDLKAAAAAPPPAPVSGTQGRRGSAQTTSSLDLTRTTSLDGGGSIYGGGSTLARSSTFSPNGAGGGLVTIGRGSASGAGLGRLPFAASRTSLADAASTHGVSPDESADEEDDLVRRFEPPHKGAYEVVAQKVRAQLEATEQLLDSLVLDDPSVSTSSSLSRSSSQRSGRSTARQAAVKDALRSSFHAFAELLADWRAMTDERERFFARRLERESEAKRLWEDNMAAIAAESARMENELESAARANERKRRALKEAREAMALGSVAEAPPSVLDPLTQDAVREPSAAEKEPSPHAVPRPGAPTSVPLPSRAVIPPAAPAAAAVAVESDDDSDESDADDFFDAIEEGSLPVHVEAPLDHEAAGAKGKPAEEKEEHFVIKDLTPYEPYRAPRNRLPIDNDQRPSLSLWSILKSNIGKDLTKISFPVSFNEPTSMLQRMAEDMEFSECLDAAVVQEDPCKRIAYVAAFAASNYSSTMGRIAKPFNPMLGETFEYCRIDKKYRYFSEQVSHHPPMSACWADSERWIYRGEVDAKNKFMGKSFEIRPTGIAHADLILPASWAKPGVKYPPAPAYATKGGSEELVVEHYSWRKVTTAVSGFITGSPTIDHYGDMLVTNHRSGETCLLTFKPRPWRGKGQEIKGWVKDAAGNETWQIAGRWIGQLVARRSGHGDGTELHPDEALPGSGLTSPSVPKEYLLLWRNSEKPAAPFNLSPFAITLNDLPGNPNAEYTPSERAPLEPWLPPTDCRLRPDQRAFEMGQYELANVLKQQQEEKQRATRRRREAGELAPHKPRWFTAEVDKDTGERVWEPSRAAEGKVEYWEERAAVGAAHVKGEKDRQWKDVEHIFIEHTLSK